MVLPAIIKGSLISKNPNTVKNRLDKIPRNVGPLIIAAGPKKKENKNQITSKRAAKDGRKGRPKMGPHPSNTGAMQKTMVNGLLSGTRGTDRRINISPIPKRISHFDSPQSD